MSLQDFIYALEVGTLRVWLLRLGIASLVALLGFYYLVSQFNGFNNPDSMDLAQVGRQIVTGNGYTTKFIRPAVLKAMTGDGTGLHPDFNRFPELVHPPLYPYVTAAIFKISKVPLDVSLEKVKEFRQFRPETLLAGFGLICLALSLPVFYVWMWRAFDDRVALLASIFMAGCDLLWMNAVTGLATSLLILLMCVAGLAINEALFLEESEEEKTLPILIWLAGAGLCVGLAVLARYSMVALLLPFAALGFLAFRNRLFCGLVTTIIPLALCIPWFLRNLNQCGNPFGYAWMEIFAQDSMLWRAFGDGEQGAMGLKPMLHYAALGLSNICGNGSAFFGGVLVPGLFMAGLLHVFRRHRAQAARWFWLGVLVLLALCNSAIVKDLDPATHPHLNSMLVLTPVLSGYAAAFLFVMLERLKLSSPILQIPVLVLVCAFQMLPMTVRVLQRNAAPYAYPPYFPPIFFVIKHWIEPEEIQASDVPWAGAWYCDRVTVWIPQKKKDFGELQDDRCRIVAMLITPESTNRPMFDQIERGEFEDWQGLIKRMDFRSLPLPFLTALPPNKGDYLYLADRTRWK